MRTIRLFRNEIRLFASHRTMSLIVLAFIFASLAYFLVPDKPEETARREGEPVTLGDVTVTSSNPIYSDVLYHLSLKPQFEANKYRLTPAQLEKSLEFAASQDELYLRFAAAYEGKEEIGYYYYYDVFSQARYAHDYLFVLDNLSSPAVRWMFIIDFDVDKPIFLRLPGMPAHVFNETFIDISGEEREQLRSSLEEITRMYELVLADSPDGFRAYADLKLEDLRRSIDHYKKTISFTRSQIALTPPGYPTEGLEDNIRHYEKAIEKLNDVSIRTWEIRKEHSVIPQDNSWRDLAIRDFEDGMNRLENLQVVDEILFSKGYMQVQYGSYRNYTQEMNARRAVYELQVSRADQSLKTGRPDVSYVTGGARQFLVKSLAYSNYVYILASLIGAWLIAGEFQSGTIRLLLVRPVSRSRLLARKYTAGLTVCLAAFLAGTLVNLAAYGTANGFSDLGNPAYGVTGPVSFWLVYLPRLGACAFPIIFAYSLAFFCSLITHSTALSAVAPVFLFAASMNTSASLKDGVFTGMPSWLRCTPVPYINVSAVINDGFIKPVANDWMLIPATPAIITAEAAEGFASPSAAACVAVLATLSLILAAGSLAVFRKTDITS